jgi:hypothetical protein
MMSDAFFQHILFPLTNAVVAPFWLLMILLPRWSVTKKIIGGRWIVLPIALTYAIPILPRLAADLPTLMAPLRDPIHAYFPVHALLVTPAGTSLAWAHILAFDMFVARWIYLDSRSRNINPLLMAPLLVFSLLAGPLGYVLYAILCAIIERSHPPTEPVVV